MDAILWVVGGIVLGWLVLGLLLMGPVILKVWRLQRRSKPITIDQNQARLAKAISVATSPFITIPVFALWIIAAYSGYISEFVQWYSLFLMLAILPPVGYIVWGVRTKRITDYHVMIRGQRFEPFMAATIGAAVLAWAYWSAEAPRELQALAVTLAGIGAIFTQVTRHWKVSIHAAAWTGGVLLVAGLVDWVWLALLGGLPIIIWARIKRGRHSLGQSTAATAMITVCVLTMMAYL